MRLRILGCSGAELPGHQTSAFLIDDELLLDAGTVGAVLDEGEQASLRLVCVTHTHLDHIKAIPFLADNLIRMDSPHSLSIMSLPENLEAMRRHLMNDVIWPDFSRIPSAESPLVIYREIEPGKETRDDGYAITAYRVNHAVPAVGYIVRKEGKAVLYTGDTGPTMAIWEGAVDLSAMIVEVSFPNDMEEMARMTGHLTPELLAAELAKVNKLPPHVLITHLKPPYAERIVTEISALGMGEIAILREGDIYSF